MTDVALEKHLTIKEVAELWRVSVWTVRRIFADVPGVLKIGHGGNRRARQYYTLSIPESVIKIEHERLQRGRQ